VKEYPCELCGKIFKQKCHLVNNTENKKFPCVKKDKNFDYNPGVSSGGNPGGNPGVSSGGNPGGSSDKNSLEYKDTDVVKKKVCCRHCLRVFSRSDSLKRHLEEERCEVLKLQKQQKENIFINLLEEEKIVTQTKKELDKMVKYDKKSIEKELRIEHENTNQIEFLMIQIKLLNEKLDEQKKEFERDKKETVEKLKEKFEKLKEKFEEQMALEKLKMMNERYAELEKNNCELKKTNEKLQNKVNKIVCKNTHNITNNTIINNNGVKLVNFGSEDLDKISHNVFVETIRSQGAGLYNKAIEGIHFNKDYPENQNIYISDINRGKVMIYKDEKWFC
jgi:hypothetical protein